MTDYDLLTEKQKRRFNQIIKISEDIMYQKGFYKLSLTELTKKLNISRSTIYEFYGSKEGLIEYVIDNISKRLNDGLTECLNNKDLDCRGKLIQLAIQQGQNLNANCYQLFKDLKVFMPHLYQKFEIQRLQREKNGYKRLIEQGIKEGLFDESFDKGFLIQLYLKMAQITGNTDILEHIRMNKQETMVAIIKVFLNGTKKS